MIIVAKRIIKQISGDRRSLAMMIVAPLLILTLLYLLLGESSYVPTALLDGATQPVAEIIVATEALSIVEREDGKSNEEMLLGGKVDVVIIFGSRGRGIKLLMLEPDSIKIAQITKAIAQIDEALGEAFDGAEQGSIGIGASVSTQGDMGFVFIYGKEEKSLFDSMGYVLLGVMSFFLIFLFSGISFVRERTTDTLERLMLTPVKTVAVVGGYVLGFGFFALLQSGLMLAFAGLVLKLPFAGAWWLALLIMLLLAMTAVVMGLLISALSRNEFQVIQFIPVVIIPQVFFSGIIPIDTLPYNLGVLAWVMPIYYGCFGLKKVLIFGDGIAELLPQILILLAIIALLFTANLAAVKKYRAAR
jgi:ABC-2 type transport system permease protein